MRINDITFMEGVKVRTPQKEQALSNDDFRMGIEYEFQAMNSAGNIMLKGLLPEIDELFTKHNIPFREIVPEHDNQIELITDVMTIPEGMAHLKKMFDILTNGLDGYTFKTSGNSGLHISISMANSSMSLNPLKFALFMNSEYIHSMFDERLYVKSFDTVISNLIKKYVYDYSTKDIIEKIETEFNTVMVSGDQAHKYFTFKIGDYLTYDGRIELRFFGGENYQVSLEQVKQQLARSLYILGVAHGDKFQKEYYRTLVNRIQTMHDNVMSSDETTVNGILDAIQIKRENGMRPPASLLIKFRNMVLALSDDVDNRHQIMLSLPTLMRFFPDTHYIVAKKLIQKLDSIKFSGTTVRMLLRLLVNEKSLIEELGENSKRAIITNSSILEDFNYGEVDFIIKEVIDLDTLDPESYILVKSMPASDEDIFDEHISTRLSTYETLFVLDVLRFDNVSDEIKEIYKQFLCKVFDLCMEHFRVNEYAYFVPNNLLLVASHRENEFKEIIKRYMKFIENTEDQEWIDLISPVIRKMHYAIRMARDAATG